MRHTSDAMGRFPFKDPTTCYIAVSNPVDGDVDLSTGMAVPKVSQHSAGDLRDLVLIATHARSGEITLYAVWPGKRRSDLFEVNLRQMANAFNWTWGEEGTETVV